MNVDTPKSVITLLEWCAGYGGIGLGLKAVFGKRLRTIAYSELEGFVQANLVSKMEAGLLDAAPIWPDIKTFPCGEFRDLVDIFVAGYPCQPFSHAGKRAGAEDERHLWPYCRKFIRTARPLWCFFENVEGHISLGLSTVLSDLEEDGYRSAFGIFSASEVGAPHQRKRVFILAHRKDDNRGVSQNRAHNPRERESRSGGFKKSSEDVAHHQQQGLQGHAGDGAGRARQEREVQEPHRPVGPDGLCGAVWPSRPGQEQYGWEPPRTVVGQPKERGERGEQQRGIRAGEEADGERAPDNNVADGPGESAGGEVKSEVGRVPSRSAAGLDISRLCGLGDSELAEIYEWMEKGTNRTDELRLCGNGVVSQTAEIAWRTLYEELCH